MEERYPHADPFFAEDDAEARELSRRERERLMRRALMLSAARSVFAEKGYADATLDEIAQRAEFGKGTLYNYFERGKEEILFAIFDDLTNGLYRLIDETFNPKLFEERPFREVFQTFIETLLTFFRDHHDDFMIMMKEGYRMNFNDEPATAAYFQRQAESIVNALVPSIETAAEKGLIRNFPPVAVANMIVGNIKGYHMHTCMASCSEALRKNGGREFELKVPDPKASAKFLTSFLLDGLLEQE